MFNNQTLKVLAGILALLLTTLACNAATSIAQPDKSTLPSTSAQAMEQAYCPAVVGSILNAATITGGEQPAEQESHLVTYSVNGNDLGDAYYDAVPADLQDELADFASQKVIWDYFTTVIPQEHRKFLTQYSILTDGEGNLLAAVAQTSNDPTRWTLEVDVADSKDYDNLTFTLLHEFGHLLTLNTDQVRPSRDVFNNPHDKEIYNQEAARCSNYFTGEGCSKRDSYINRFYRRFWKDIYPEWQAVDETKSDHLYFEKLSEFYLKYQDQFVTSYAATNPGEDIAETWAYFILTPKPQGNTIADQKVLFFYDYPELVRLRQEILNNLCNAFP